MRNIRLTIQYDGTDYAGWQFQKNARSIQEVIEHILKRIVSEKVNLIGSGRTDAGVHAKAQTANFKTRSKIPIKNIQKALNSNLPKDIVISGIKEARPDFDSQFDAKSKVYRYTIATGDFVEPFIREFVSRCRFKLNLAHMRKAAGILLGVHDFKSFQTNGADYDRHTFRAISEITIEKDGGLVYIDIEADGFLYNMARNIVGTLIEVGRGKIRAEDVRRILSKKDRRYCGPTAPASGLCLEEVKY